MKKYYLMVVVSGMIATASYGSSLRCGGNIIGKKMSVSDVVEACGGYVSKRTRTNTYEKTVKGVESSVFRETTNLVIDDEATNSKLTLVEFVDDIYSKTTRLRIKGGSEVRDCAEKIGAIKKGDSMSLVYLVCGEPEKSRHSKDDMHPYGSDGEKRSSSTHIWTFSSEKKRLLLTFVDSKLRRIDSARR